MSVCFCVLWAILHSSHTVTKALVATHQLSVATFLIISNAKAYHCNWVEIHCKSHSLALPKLPHLQLGMGIRHSTANCTLQKTHYLMEWYISKPRNHTYCQKT